MPDREKVINDLQDAVNDDWMWRHADYYALTMERAIALLKEDCHNCKLECLLQKYDELKEKYESLLKEQEAKTGKWIPIESPTGVEAFGIKEMTVMDVRCSACGSEEDVSFTGYKYCPRCGAKMEGRQSEWIGIRLSKGC